MPIVITCESCNSKLKAPDNAAGKKIRCPKCQGVIAVPAASSVQTAPPAPAASLGAPPPVPSAPPVPMNEQPFENLDDQDYADGRDLEERPRKKKKKARPPEEGPNKVVVGILGILLGGYGVHKFLLGYKKEGLIMLLVTLCTCFVGGLVMGPIGLIEGIIYLTKSDEDFVATYINNKRGWF